MNIGMIDKLIDSNKIEKFIIRLIIFVNNFCKYELDYIKEKYNIDSHENFLKYFKKNYKKKILFGSPNAEKLFINFINIDMDFIKERLLNYTI